MDAVASLRTAAALDHAARGPLADALEEAGFAEEAAFQRWLLRRPQLIRRQSDQSEANDYRQIVDVEADDLPEGMHLPSMYRRRGGNFYAREGCVTVGVWMDVAACERDLFRAWKRWVKRAVKLPLFEGD